MEITRNNILCLQIDNESDVGVSRRKSVGLAHQIGFDEIKAGEVAIVVTELVTNVLKHGGGKGKFLVYQIENENNQKAIEIWCCDMGNGISNLEESIIDGFTNKNSLGIGLGSIRRFSDEFEINPEKIPEKTGITDLHFYTNCIRILKWVPEKKWIGKNRSLTFGAASRSKPGESFNGDTYVISHLSQTKTIVAIVDGLGHGRDAHIASQMVKEKLLLRPELPVDALIQHIHNGVRGTRGSVIGVLLCDTDINKISYVGIGNIEGFLLANKKKQGLLSLGGIIGHKIRTPRVFEYNFNPGDFVCLYSDGITSRWNLDDINWDDHPQTNTEFIINHFSRQNDDATILIIRYDI